MIANKCISVDLEGLRKQLARKGPSFVAWELLQNALDADGCTEVKVDIECITSRAQVKLVVEDNSPVGFRDLSHAWTLFAPSEKKGDPTKRGFMNLGEKLALSMCESARIETTSGGVAFDEDGRHLLRKKRERGTRVEMVLRITHAEGLQVRRELVTQAIPPAGVSLTINGEPVSRPEFVEGYEQELPTRIADAEGYLRASRRKATVALYKVAQGDHARLYEMGIPVVEVDCQWHIDVGQKVPLNSDRDNVTPGYLKEVYTGVLNHTAHLLEREQAAEPWVTTALESPDVAPVAVETVLTAQYGEKRVIADPSDQEGTKLAITQGYTVIPGGSFTKPAWENIRKAGAALPAGKVTPSPKPYGPDGEELPLVPQERWTVAEVLRVDFATRLAHELLGRKLRVRIVDAEWWGFRATYGFQGLLTLNLAALGHDWFELPHHHEAVLDLLLHEFAHDAVSDHLSAKYHEATTKLAGRAVQLAIEHPEVYR